MAACVLNLAVVELGEFLFVFEVENSLDLLKVGLLGLNALFAGGDLGQQKVKVLFYGLDLYKIFVAILSFDFEDFFFEHVEVEDVGLADQVEPALVQDFIQKEVLLRLAITVE